MIDVVVLTVKSTPTRRKMFKERNAKHLDFRFHFGVDAKQMSAAEYSRLMKPEPYPFIPDNVLAPGEIACTRGHGDMIRNFVTGFSSSDFLLVLEDDADVPPEVPPLLNKIAEVTDDGIVILGGPKKMKSNLIFGRMVHKFADGKKLRLVSRWCWRSISGTSCYMVSHSVAKKLLSSHEKYDFRTDDWTERMRVSKIKKMYFSHLIMHHPQPGPTYSLLATERSNIRKFFSTATGRPR